MLRITPGEIFRRRCRDYVMCNIGKLEEMYPGEYIAVLGETVIFHGGDRKGVESQVASYRELHGEERKPFLIYIHTESDYNSML